jgi:hypothetical protein
MTYQNEPAPSVGRTVVRKQHRNLWNERRRQTFLTALTETANVREASKAAEMSAASAYDLKSRDARFAADWRKALEVGYSELEMMLLRHSIKGVERTEMVEIGEERTLKYVKTIRSFPLSVAMRLLMSHHDEVATFRQSDAGEGDTTSATERARVYLDNLRARLFAGELDQDEPED